MDTPTSATPDEKTPPPEEALATQPGKEKSNPAGPLEITTERFNSSVARLTSNSMDELHKLASELQKMQEFLKSEVDSVQRQIDSAVAGIFRPPRCRFDAARCRPRTSGILAFSGVRKPACEVRPSNLRSTGRRTS